MPTCYRCESSSKLLQKKCILGVDSVNLNRGPEMVRLFDDTRKQAPKGACKSPDVGDGGPLRLRLVVTSQQLVDSTPTPVQVLLCCLRLGPGRVSIRTPSRMRVLHA